MAGRRIAPCAEDDMNTQAVSVKTLATIAALSGVCFLVSLFLPCIYVEDDPTPFMGLALFLWGPFGILDGVVAWYANPFLALMALLLVAQKVQPCCPFWYSVPDTGPIDTGRSRNTHQ